MHTKKELEEIEVELLLEGIYRRYGYDFKHYSRESLKRRLIQARTETKAIRYTQMLDSLFHDDKVFDKFLKHMSVTVTDMFRDPGFYISVREKVIPFLKTFPFIKIWHAGCATGEEVYSMAILLHEEYFLERSRFYATDFNKISLNIAQKGIYPYERVKKFDENYKAADGKISFTEYYNDGYDFVKFKDFIKNKITFSYHNLVADGVFGEMNMICCRNVLIYFDKTLQNRTLKLFSDSLRHGGYLCLGSKETLKFTEIEDLFETIDQKQKIYKKIR